MRLNLRNIASVERDSFDRLRRRRRECRRCLISLFREGIKVTLPQEIGHRPRPSVLSRSGNSLEADNHFVDEEQRSSAPTTRGGKKEGEIDSSGKLSDTKAHLSSGQLERFHSGIS